MRDLIKDFPVNVFNIHENLIEVLLEMQVISHEGNLCKDNCRGRLMFFAREVLKQTVLQVLMRPHMNVY